VGTTRLVSKRSAAGVVRRDDKDKKKKDKSGTSWLDSDSEGEKKLSGDGKKRDPPKGGNKGGKTG
jgi:hypothetical protein